MAQPRQFSSKKTFEVVGPILAKCLGAECVNPGYEFYNARNLYIKGKPDLLASASLSMDDSGERHLLRVSVYDRTRKVRESIYFDCTDSVEGLTEKLAPIVKVING